MKNLLKICVILCVVCTFGFGAPAVSNSTSEGKMELQGKVSGQAKSATPKPIVGVYYYPWYHKSFLADSRHTWSHAMRLLLKHPQKPKAGLYDSWDADVIGEHISQSIRGGISMWAVSWWGPDSSKDAVLKNHILKHPDAGKLKYAILYESTGRLRSFSHPDYRNWLRDMDYLNKTYFDHPYYFKIDGRPVVFVYLSREYFRDKGHRVLAEMRKKFPQIYLVGDDVYSIENINEYQASWAGQFDAVTAYDVYGQSIGRYGCTKKAIDFLASTYRHAKVAANSTGTAFMPTVAPGYNDTAVRKGHPGRARYFTDVKDSKEGDIFREMIDKAAFPNLDPTCGNVMMVTSFNEWYEDSQIEATSGKAPQSNTDISPSKTYYTGGQTYRDYEYLYLDILSDAVNSYRNTEVTIDPLSSGSGNSQSGSRS